jgi:hypothetical protein
MNEAHQNGPHDRGYRLMHIYLSQMECSERDGLVLVHGYDEDTAKYEEKHPNPPTTMYNK